MTEQTSEILTKLNNMHTDILLIKSDLVDTKKDVEDHEVILRGASKVNGIVSEIRALKVAQNTAHKLWLSMVSIVSVMIAWIGINK